MAQTHPETAATAELMRRFNEVFLRHDPRPLRDLIADDCVIEKISLDADGDRCIGRDACVALWTAIATTPGTHFDLEETYAMGDRAVIRWRFWSDDKTSVRGVNLMRVRDGQIVEAMGYTKGN
ncbi:MAG TPA: nuclear transport factor 2 family protein [Candidatus Binataceae bacterium]|jgi:ketosteroid isomerase-like protein|nr:nuclear transport factor 2 family protein [Candidatus Binataceae bacterium]